MIKNIAAVFLVIAWMLVIFALSNSEGDASNNTSNHFTDLIIKVVTNVTPEDNNYEVVRNKVSFIVRKTAHFTEYFILGLLLMNIMFILGVRGTKIILPVIAVIIYAFSDEFHQVFVSGRNGYIGDVLLDSSAGMFAIYLYHRFIMMRFSHEKVAN